jgi:predicted DCC family thiol-disulfide oxidoreductase YuxK
MDKTLPKNQYDLSKGIVVFDGYCVLCSNTVKFLTKIDKNRKLLFTTVHSELGQQLSGTITPGAESIILVWQNKILVQSDAVLAIFQIIGIPWSLLKVFKIIPRTIRDGLYDLIARTRYKVFGKNDECMIPDENVRDRFII